MAWHLLPHRSPHGVLWLVTKTARWWATLGHQASGALTESGPQFLPPSTLPGTILVMTLRGPAHVAGCSQPQPPLPESSTGLFGGSLLLCCLCLPTRSCPSMGILAITQGQTRCMGPAFKKLIELQGKL